MKSLKLSKIKKKPLFFIFVLLLLASSIAGITYAYFVTRGNIENQFKTTAFNVRIDENFEGKWGTKEVDIVNEDASSVVIRVNYNELWSMNINNAGKFATNNTCVNSSIELEDGTLLTLNNKYNGVDVVTKGWTDNWNNYFKYNPADGWYYYTKVLDSGKSVRILNTIALNSNVSSSPCYKDYSLYDYNLTFNFEAIQATEEAIQTNWGHTVTIGNDGNVSWGI